MAVKTRPFRAYTEDIDALRFLGEVEGMSPQEVLHSALASYMTTNRERLGKVFEATQRALRDGDIDALTAQLSASADERVAALAETVPTF